MAKVKLVRIKNKGKYNNTRVTVGGKTFDSKGEANRYSELALLLQAGEIHDLRLQVRFPIKIHGQLICVYVADFVYYDCRVDREVVEDYKGCRTDVYKLKKKLMLAVLGIDVREVRAK